MKDPWWNFLRRITTCDLVINMLMARLAEVVQIILGDPLTYEELLILPKKWKGSKLWAIYANIFDNDVGRYCGSGTSKYGVQSRLSFYDKVHDGKVKGEPTKHSDWLKRKDLALFLLLFIYYVVEIAIVQ